MRYVTPARNVVRNAVRPQYTSVMFRKLLQRIFNDDQGKAATSWSEKVAVDPAQYFNTVDSSLWAEADRFANEFGVRAKEKLSELDVELGGPGALRMIYFLVRRTSASVVVETGVAAGWSSATILHALQRNGGGHLYSSDFPYFRLPQPEQFVGVLVDGDLHRNWTLRTKGDRENLPEFLVQIDSIDLVHYDSDKSTDGRQFAVDLLLPRLSPGGVLLMDDIQDTTYFRDFVEGFPGEWQVFRVGSKFVGMATTPLGPIPFN